MRKIIFLMSVFFIFFIISCQNYGAPLQEEISIELPKWPPEDKMSKFYPQLSRWKINIKSADYSTCFYTEENEKIIVPVIKNQPMSITAEPVTLNSNNQELIFFYPAGFLYPYNKERKFTWNNGFLSSIMASLFSANSKKSKSTSEFISRFNWKKAIEIINNKIENKTEPYNPWLLNRENILTKISEKKFSAVYLNLSSVYTIENVFINEISKSENQIYISPFPPANAPPGLLLKKALPQQFMLSPGTAATITYISSKNVSLDHRILPILIEEYETK